MVSSRSPDLLDNPDLPAESILAVEFEEGVNRIAPLDEAGRSALQDRRYTPGELLRLNPLQPDPNAPPREAQELGLFE